MSLVSEQLAKIDADSGANQLRARIQQEAVPAAVAGPSPIEQDLAQQQAIGANQAASDAKRAELEKAHPMLEVAATGFGRGIMDAVLAPGALEGAWLEKNGEWLGWHGLQQFGRDLGNASSGQSGIDAAAYLFGGGGQRGLTTAERVDREIENGQKAWPTLSTVSHGAGMAVPLLAGGVAGAAPKGLAAIGLAGVEGASGGAQAAYERNDSLRDVVTSSLIGGAIGAGTAGAFEGLGSMVRSPALRKAAAELAEDQNLAAVGVKRAQVAELFGADAPAAEQKVSDIVNDLSSYRFESGPLAGKSIIRALQKPETLASGVAQAAQETGDALAGARADVLARAAENPNAAPFVAQMQRAMGEAGSAAAASSQVDSVFSQITEALGGNPAEYDALASRAQNFRDLASIVEKAQSTPAAATGEGIGSMLAKAHGAAKLLAGANPVAAAAHWLVTDIGQKLVKQRAASTVATLANTMVLDTVSTALKQIAPTLEVATGSAAGSEASRKLDTTGDRPKQLTPEQKQDRYQEQMDRINKAVSTPDPEARQALLEKVSDLPPSLVVAASADMTQRMMQLHADLPKPTPNLRGKAYETLSSDQLRLANAMYEATVNPMSVFSDFAAGDVDYDKVRYAWKQYPGLQKAAQAGLNDMLRVQLDDKRRAAIPDSLLTQLDNLFGMEGQLQPTLDRSFALRMDAQLKQAAPAAPPPRGGAMQLPTSKPTFTERLSGQR